MKDACLLKLLEFSILLQMKRKNKKNEQFYIY